MAKLLSFVTSFVRKKTISRQSVDVTIQNNRPIRLRVHFEESVSRFSQSFYLQPNEHIDTHLKQGTLIYLWENDFNLVGEYHVAGPEQMMILVGKDGTVSTKPER